jgi:hypothetical protein
VIFVAEAGKVSRKQKIRGPGAESSPVAGIF